MTEESRKNLFDLTDNLKLIQDGNFTPNPFEFELITNTTRSIINSILCADEAPESAETYNGKADVLNITLKKHILKCDKNPFY